MDFTHQPNKLTDIIPQAPTELDSTNNVTGGTADLKTSAVVAPNVRPAPSLNASDQYPYSMRDYFSRPVIIDEIVWTAGTVLGNTTAVWTWIPLNDFINRKFSGNFLFRYNLRINIQISGSPFYYATGLAAYQPLANQDGSRASVSGASSIGAFVKNSQQLTKSWFSASGSTSLDMKIPFIYDRPYLDAQETMATHPSLGTLYLSSTPLRYAGSGTPTSIKIVINAWLEDVEISVPTIHSFGAVSRFRYEGILSEMADSKIVSNTADTVSAVADHLSNVPVIGGIAKAASFGAKLVGGIARIFGFSKPVNFDSNVRVITFNPFADMATTVGKDPVSKLTLDPKQELTVDTSSIDRVHEDQLALAYFYSKESLLDIFTLDESMGTGDPVLTMAVTPDLANRSTYAVDTDTYMWSQPTLLQVASLPFLFWRGTICVRIKTVCSQYHKGKVAVVYNPRSQLASSFTAKQQSLHTAYIDIAPDEEVVVKVNMCQTTAYLPISEADSLDESFYFPLSTWTEAQPTDVVSFANGVLQLLVVNPITSSVDPVPPVDFLVTVWGEDMEFQRPNPVGISTGLYYRMEATKSEMVIGTNNRTADNGASIYFGEVPVSFRQLLKRYQAYFMKSTPVPAPENYYTQAVTFVDLSYPVIFQSQSEQDATQIALETADYVLPGAEDTKNDQPIFQYLRRMFIGFRGSFRYMLTPISSGATVGFVENTYSVGNLANEIFNAASVLTTPYTGMDSDMLRFMMANMGGGQKFDLKNSATMQFELPYQCRELFLPCQQAVGELSQSFPLVRAGFVSDVAPEVSEGYWYAHLGYQVDMIPGEDFQFCVFAGGAGWSSSEPFPP